MNKSDSIFDLPCECGCCEPDDTIDCEGCLLQNLPYCWGGSEDDYWMYCNNCFHELSNDLVTVVIQQSKPNIYMNC